MDPLEKMYLSEFHSDWWNELMTSTKKPTKRPKRNPAPTAVSCDIEDDELIDMLWSRMRWSGDRDCPFSTITVGRIKDTVAVFVIASNDAIVIKDDLNLFPSDALITQLRLLEGSK